MTTRKKSGGRTKPEGAAPQNFDKPVVLQEPRERPAPPETAAEAEGRLAAREAAGQTIDLSAVFNKVAYGSAEPAERPVTAWSRLYDVFTQAVRDNKGFIAAAVAGTGLTGAAGGAVAALAGGGLAAVFMGVASPLLCIPAVLGIALASGAMGAGAARLVGADTGSEQQDVNGGLPAILAGVAGAIGFLGYPIVASEAGTGFSVLSHLGTTAAFSAAAGAATLAASTAVIGTYNGVSNLIDRLGHGSGPG